MNRLCGSIFKQGLALLWLSVYGFAQTFPRGKPNLSGRIQTRENDSLLA